MGAPVPVFRFLVPNRRAPGTVHNLPGTEIQFCTDLSLWVKPWHNPFNWLAGEDDVRGVPAADHAIRKEWQAA